MTGEFIGLVAVILTLGIPLAALYTYYRVRKLRTEERLAALARGAEIPMEPELSQYAKSRRAGILLVSAGIGFILMFAMISRAVNEPETMAAAAFGVLPLAVGIGYFLDAMLIRRDLKGFLNSCRSFRLRVIRACTPRARPFSHRLDMLRSASPHSRSLTPNAKGRSPRMLESAPCIMPLGNLWSCNDSIN